MAENSTIEWTDHTWNPWIGCQKLSPACDNCYAERDAPARVLRARGIETWGPHGQRVRTSEENWKLPGRWNRRAEVAAAGWADGVKLYGSEEAAHAAGHLKPRRPRVFCLSQGDWLDNAVPVERLADMLNVVRLAPALDWLLLTKRIGAWKSRVAAALALAATSEGRARWPELAKWLADWVDGRAPAHVWIGATVATQAEADRDVRKLLGVPAAVRFLSIEPMLGPIDLERPRPGPDLDQGGGRMICQPWLIQSGIDWVICGGESGPHARPMHPDWPRSLRDQCARAGVPFLFKQWGEWRMPREGEEFSTAMGRAQKTPAFIVAPTGTVHCFENDQTLNGGAAMLRVGKKAAGRPLDGRVHDGYPEACQ